MHDEEKVIRHCEEIIHSHSGESRIEFSEYLKLFEYYKQAYRELCKLFRITDNQSLKILDQFRVQAKKLVKKKHQFMRMLDQMINAVSTIVEKKPLHSRAKRKNNYG